MKFKVIIVFFLLLFSQNSNSENDSGYVELPTLDEIFYIGKMNSHNNDFVLFFKTREKAILAKGQEYNYITDYPQDLYIYDRKPKKTEPLITYEWFPRLAKFYYHALNNRQNLQEKLENRNLINRILQFAETIRMLLKVQFFLFFYRIYINLEDSR